MDNRVTTFARRAVAGRGRRALGCLGIGFCLLFVGQQLALADCGVQEVEIVVGSEGFTSDDFGRSVDIDGDYAIVGTSDHDEGLESGAVYFYKRTGGVWSEQQKAKGSDIGAASRFGSAVAISGNTAVVGAKSHNIGRGAAYVFVRMGDTWVEQAKLVAPNEMNGDEFGRSVDIDGDTIIVGAWLGDVTGAVNGGTASIFVRNGVTWTHQQTVTASDIMAFQGFGITVGVSGDTAIAGNPEDNASGNDSGAVYVFQRNGGVWNQVQKIKAPDASAADYFGEAAAISNDRLVVGSARDDQACPGDVHCNSGSAYVYVRVGGVWQFEQLLTASDATPVAFFGYAVAIADDVVTVGAPFAPGTIGAAYVFARRGGTWVEQERMGATPNPTMVSQFGFFVGTDGESAIVGAPYMSTLHTGEAYIYDLNCAGTVGDLNGDGVVDGADLATLLANWGPCAGCPADLNGDGVVDGADLAQLLANWT